MMLMLMAIFFAITIPDLDAWILFVMFACGAGLYLVNKILE